MKSKSSSKEDKVPLRPSSIEHRIKKRGHGRHPKDTHDGASYTVDVNNTNETVNRIPGGVHNGPSYRDDSTINNEAMEESETVLEPKSQDPAEAYRGYQERLNPIASGSYNGEQLTSYNVPQKLTGLATLNAPIPSSWSMDKIRYCNMTPDGYRASATRARQQDKPSPYSPSQQYHQYGRPIFNLFEYSQYGPSMPYAYSQYGPPVQYAVPIHPSLPERLARLGKGPQQLAEWKADTDLDDEDEVLDDADVPRFVCFGRYIAPQDGVLVDSGESLEVPRGQDLGMTTSREDDYDFGFRDRRTTPTFSRPVPPGLATMARHAPNRDDEEDTIVGATQYHIPANQQAAMNFALTGHPSHLPLSQPSTMQATAGSSSNPYIPRPLLDSGGSVARNISGNVQQPSESWLLNSPAITAPERSARLPRQQAIQAGNQKQTSSGTQPFITAYFHPLVD